MARPDEIPLQRNLFEASAPGFDDSYAEVRRIALLPDQPNHPWPALRKRLLSSLRKRGDWHVIIDVHLDDGEIAEAIEAVEKAEKARRAGRGGLYFGWGSHPQGYMARVAAAAEESHPQEAVTLYRRMVDYLIAARSRESATRTK